MPGRDGTQPDLDTEITFCSTCKEPVVAEIEEGEVVCPFCGHPARDLGSLIDEVMDRDR